MGDEMNVTKIRVVALPEDIQKIGDAIAGMLEDRGWQLIEHSKDFPCAYPEEGKRRVYLVGVRKQEMSDGQQ